MGITSLRQQTAAALVAIVLRIGRLFLDWERFYIEPRPNGRIAIKTYAKGTYLSVQPGK